MALTDLTKSLNDAVSSYNDSLTEAVKSPGFSITMGGKVLTQLDDRIMSLSLTDNRGFDADQLSISIDDSDGMVALPPRGAELAVSFGWLGEPLIYKGLYTVDEVSHEGPADTIGVTARSADFREEFNVKREVSWHDVTVERVVSAIAHRYGLKAQISEMLMDIEIDHADQTQESDMSFLTRMADMLGAIATVKNGSLLFILPGGGVTADGKALPSASIDRTSGDRHRFRIADRDAYTGVRAYWLDLNFGKKKKVSVKRRKPAKPKKRRAAAVRAITWRAQTVTFMCCAKPTRMKRLRNVRQRLSGNSFSVARQSFRSPWRVAAQSFTQKCTLLLAVLRMK